MTWRTPVVPPATRIQALQHLQEIVGEGYVLLGKSMPASVRRYEWVRQSDEDDAEFGWRITDVDEPGSILPILESVTRELEHLRKKGVLRVHESFNSMTSDELDEQIDSGGFVPTEDREWMKACERDMKFTYVWRDYVLSRSVLMKREAGSRNCGRGCQECEAVPCCSGCKRSKHAMLPCACVPKPATVFACKRCKYVGMGYSAGRVSAELRARRIDTSQIPRAHDQQVGLALLLRREEVSELLEALGQPVWEDGEKDAPYDQWSPREDRLAAAQMRRFNISVWFDGSPVLNRSFQAHTYHFT